MIDTARVRSDIDALIIFPHQLFFSNASLARHKTVYVIEDALYFKHYRFHKLKLILHRASMRAHAAFLQESAAAVVYLDTEHARTMDAVLTMVVQVSKMIHYIDPVDDWLHRRLLRSAKPGNCTLIVHSTDMFINSCESLRPHIDRPTPSMARFYVAERKRLGILVSDQRPVGGRWSLDAENRKRLPSTREPPTVLAGADDDFTAEARQYVDMHFAENPGRGDGFAYPVTHDAARRWLMVFLEQRLADFGAYEDAISTTHRFLFHSVLTPMLNIGLLTPREVVEATLAHAEHHEIPLNSLEGFIRQIIGWREYVRGNYEYHGRAQRTRNFWNHQRPLPTSFWTGRTGIDPIDMLIAKLLETAYLHHIERLMVLSNFMLLCEFSPDEVYRWFMEMFIDSYDWVMVPNVYAMGLHADGGLMMTKPYIASSSYLLRMSDLKRGPWCAIWDGLFWRFIAKHRAFFDGNPRLRVMLRHLDRLGDVKLRQHIETAETFLDSLK